MRNRKSRARPSRLRRFTIWGIIAAVIFVGGSVLLTINSNHKPKEAVSSSSSSSSSIIIKNVPKAQNKRQNQSSSKVKSQKVPVTDAQQNVSQGLATAMSIIQEAKSLPGEQVEFNGLSDDTTKQMYTSFSTPEPVQQFNDIINYSSRNGMLMHGDAGSPANAQISTPKPGDPYTIDQADVQPAGKDDGNYYFTVDLQYHANSDGVRTIPLKITAQKIDGKITQIVQNGHGTYPN